MSQTEGQTWYEASFPSPEYFARIRPDPPIVARLVGWLVACL